MSRGTKLEVEAKYEVSNPGAADRYLVAPEIGPFVATGPVRTVKIEDHYVDSAEWGLAMAGYAARLRHSGQGVVVGLKSRTSAGEGLHRRQEIEAPATDSLAASSWPPSRARSIVLELCGDEPLLETIVIRQLRRVRDLRAARTGTDTNDAARAELSLDEVEVLAGGRVVGQFEELEVELKRGDEAALRGLAAELDRDASIKRATHSKLERAMEAVREVLPTLPQEAQERLRSARVVFEADDAPERAGNGRGGADETGEGDQAAGVVENDRVEPAAEPEPDHRARAAKGSRTRRSVGVLNLGVQVADTMPEAALKILTFNFQRLKRREAGIRRGPSSDDLHDMRVASRRMMAAWLVFDDAFKAGRTKKLRRSVETIADRLGTVRDLDVLIADVEAYRQGLDEASVPDIEPLVSLWQRQRDQARRQLLADLDSPAYEGFQKSMEQFLESDANAAARVAQPTAPHRVRDCAASRIWACYEAVRVYELVLPWADVETLHALRIEAKRFRYALEFFSEVLGPDAGRLLQRVVALQDHLGCLHDADVAAKLTRDLLVARSGELTRPETEAIGAYLHYREREVARRRRALGPIWRAVNGAPFRRALGRATAAL